MKIRLIYYIAFLLISNGLLAQEKYIGLSTQELSDLSSLARSEGDQTEVANIQAYQNFMAKVDTLYEVFDTKLSEDGISQSFKNQLNEGLRAINELQYYGRNYREALSAGTSFEAQANLNGYYSALERLELKEYFLSLFAAKPTMDLKEEGSSLTPKHNDFQGSGTFSYYLGFKLNYSIVSFSSVKPMNDPLAEVEVLDDGIGGISSNIYLGISYRVNSQFSAFAELGFSGQNLSHSVETTYTDNFNPDVSFSFKHTRDLKQRFTDLKLGGTYHYQKLQAHLALQFSFMNSLELIETYEDSFLPENATSTRTEEEVIGINTTRTFLVLGASYPVYQFYALGSKLSVDALFDLSFGLSSVQDEQIQDGDFTNVENFNNSLINLGLRLRL